MGKKITDYTNGASVTPDDASLLDVSEKIGVSSYESRKWTLSAFKTWVNSWVVATSVAWADITGKPTTIAGYGITDAVDTAGGTANYVSKFSDANTLTDSQIIDNGTNIGIGTAVDTNTYVNGQAGKEYGIKQTNTTGGYALHGVSTGSSTISGISCGVGGNGGGSSVNYGGSFGSSGATGVYGYGVSATATMSSATRNVAIKGYASGASTNYAIQLQDGTEVTGRFLKCVDGSQGYAHWAGLSASDISSFVGLPCEIQLSASDLTTALSVGTSVAYDRMPYAMTVTEVRASLLTAGSTSGTTTIDINLNGVSILSTKLTIDATEKTSTTAVTPAVISTSALTDDAEITIDIDAISGGATEAGLIITLIGTRA